MGHSPNCHLGLGHKSFFHLTLSYIKHSFIPHAKREDIKHHWGLNGSPTHPHAIAMPWSCLTKLPTQLVENSGPYFYIGRGLLLPWWGPFRLNLAEGPIFEKKLKKKEGENEKIKKK